MKRSLEQQQPDMQVIRLLFSQLAQEPLGSRTVSNCGVGVRKAC